MLAPQAKRFPAGRQQSETSTRREQQADLGGRLQDLLAIVQEDEHVHFVQPGNQCLQDGLPLRFTDIEGSGNSGHDMRGIRERSKIDKNYAIAEHLAHVAGDVEREVGLARAAHARHCDELDVRAMEQRGKRSPFLVSAEQGS